MSTSTFKQYICLASLLALPCFALSLSAGPRDIFSARAREFRDLAEKIGIPDAEAKLFVRGCEKFYRLGQNDNGYICICTIDKILRNVGLDYLYQTFDFRKLNEQPYARACAVELSVEREENGLAL